MVRAAGLVNGLGHGMGEPRSKPEARPKHGVQKRQHVVNLFALSAQYPDTMYKTSSTLSTP
jgi:hypothetical protein